MLKSIFKKDMILENNVNRKTNKKNLRVHVIILYVTFILFIAILSIYNSNQYNNGLRKVIDKTNAVLLDFGFNLQNIYIIGDKNLQKKIILNIINNEEHKTIFDIDLIKIHNDLLLNDWVETVQIERILPSSIKIKIVEKHPLAIWQTISGNKLITKSGSIISTTNTNFFQNELPIIIGKDGNKNAFLILQILKKIPDLYNNVWSMSYINKRRWNVHLKQGITLLLPKEKVNDAWNKIYVLQKKYQILDLGLTEIDIRNHNQVFGKINFDKKLYLKRKKL